MVLSVSGNTFKHYTFYVRKETHTSTTSFYLSKETHTCTICFYLCKQTHISTTHFYLYKETNICHLDEFSPQSQNTGHQGHENFLDQQPFCEGGVEMCGESLSVAEVDWAKFHYLTQFLTTDCLSNQTPSLEAICLHDQQSLAHCLTSRLFDVSCLNDSSHLIAYDPNKMKAKIPPT